MRRYLDPKKHTQNTFSGCIWKPRVSRVITPFVTIGSGPTLYHIYMDLVGADPRWPYQMKIAEEGGFPFFHVGGGKFMEFKGLYIHISHIIHVRYIYLHLADFLG